MGGFEEDDGPEEGEFPDVFDAVEEDWLDDVGRADQPVEGREMGGAVVGREGGCGVGGYECHDLACDCIGKSDIGPVSDQKGA